jgi:hypothetical protein
MLTVAKLEPTLDSLAYFSPHLLTPTISETLAYRSGENNGEEFFSDFDEF